MKITLTPDQKRHLKSIRWLYQGPRGSGRTTLLAYVLIETVMATQESMKIADHQGTRDADRALLSMIEIIIHQNQLPLTIDRQGINLIWNR